MLPCTLIFPNLSFPYSAVACETSCQRCLPGLPGLSQPQTSISAGGFFNTNVYVALSFKACDGKVDAKFSWACQKMSQMAQWPHLPTSWGVQGWQCTYSEQVSYAIVFLMGHLSYSENKSQPLTKARGPSKIKCLVQWHRTPQDSLANEIKWGLGKVPQENYNPSQRSQGQPEIITNCSH